MITWNQVLLAAALSAGGGWCEEPISNFLNLVSGVTVSNVCVVTTCPVEGTAFLAVVSPVLMPDSDTSL